jgi:actin-like ATPase involved in cell morphogenesis
MDDLKFCNNQSFSTIQMSTEKVPLVSSALKVPKLVVGLDFGTCGTGYGFKFSASKSNEIKKNHTWPKKKLPYSKTKSCILYKDGKFVSHADAAFDDFTSMEFEDSVGCEFFDLIKLDLMKVSTPKDELEEEEEEVNFLDRNTIISRVADYLEKMKVFILKHIGDIDVCSEKDIKWVVSIPSACTLEYANNLKEALLQAEYFEDKNSLEERLFIIKESEAAGVTCFLQGEFKLNNGEKYMIVDAGGGTVDITSHKIENMRLKEISITHGKNLGSSFIDRNFESYIACAIGESNWEQIKTDYPQDYHALMQKWESVKIDTEKYSKCKIEVWDELKEELIHSKFSKIEPKRSKLILEEEDMKKIFQPIFKGIIDVMKDTVQETSKKKSTKLDHLFVVGGLSQNKILREEIKSTFGKDFTNIFFPVEGGSSVIDGCVLIGLDPSLIASRRSVFTYGIEVDDIFDEELDKKEYLFYSKQHGDFYCHHRFFSFVKKDEDVPFEKEIKKTFNIDTNAPKSIINLFKSKSVEPRYVNDPLVGEVFSVSINNDPSHGTTLEVSMSFGKSVITVTVTSSSGEKVPFEVQFNSKFQTK